MLPAILLAVTSGALFPAVATYRYDASLNGRPIGVWSVSVKNSGDAFEVDETSSATIAGMQLAATAALVLGPDLAPTRYAGSYQTPGASPNVSVTLTPSSATIIGALSNQPQQRSLLPNTHHFVVIEPGLLAGLFALPAQLASWKDGPVTWITPTTGSAQSLEPNAATSLARPAGVPAQDAIVDIEQPLTLALWYDPATLVPDRVSVPSQNAVLVRERP